MHERLELAEREKRDAIALAEAKIANALQSAAARKDTEIQALKAQLQAGRDVARKLAVAEALGTASKERDALANELAQARNGSQAAAQLAEAKLAPALQAEAAKKDLRFRRCKPARGRRRSAPVGCEWKPWAWSPGSAMA